MRLAASAILALTLFSHAADAQTPPTEAPRYRSIEIDAGRKGITLDGQDEQNGPWRRICTLPCYVPSVGGALLYRVEGEGIVPSRTFVVPHDASRVTVATAWKGTRPLGGVLMVGGAVMVSVPYFVFLGDALCDEPKCATSQQTKTLAYVSLGAGLVAGVLGFVMFLRGDTTINVDQDIRLTSTLRLSARGLSFLPDGRRGIST